MNARARACALLALALSACVPLPPPPEPGETADVAAMTAVVARLRSRPPHRGYPLTVAPVTVSFRPDRYPLDLGREFAGAVADLSTGHDRLEPVRPPYLAGVPVRREGVYDPYDLEQYLLIRLSPVGFSADSSRAVVLVVLDCGPGCGSQSSFGLRRAANGGWRVAQVRRVPEPPPPDTTRAPPP